MWRLMGSGVMTAGGWDCFLPSICQSAVRTSVTARSSAPKGFRARKPHSAERGGGCRRERHRLRRATASPAVTASAPADEPREQRGGASGGGEGAAGTHAVEARSSWAVGSHRGSRTRGSPGEAKPKRRNRDGALFLLLLLFLGHPLP
ncbi:hypothetical protein SKAU_G00390160 [Synaphobranchus kaupii]|uniref:Uncharacterized protein n=1 Tax=Synaphobranchus kaupii TaxID=118154 RepID=A0A9Q1EBA8_SYNKA|nr:hypothetical protein SKAU_G00390160 [Synaphobranchus kaupii]